MLDIYIAVAQAEMKEALESLAFGSWALRVCE